MTAPLSDSKGAAIEKLIDDLWGRALDMTSPDFANDKDYETAQSNYKKHCLKELHAILAQERQKIFMEGQHDCRVARDPTNHKYFKEAVAQEVNKARISELVVWFDMVKIADLSLSLEQDMENRLNELKRKAGLV